MMVRRTFGIACLGWAILLPLATFAAARGASAGGWWAFAAAVYGVGSFVCHQLPERSFQFFGGQMPVCARCTGIYAGAAAASLVALVRAKRDALEWRGTGRLRLALLGSAVPALATLIYEWTTGSAPTNLVRALSGVPIGAAVAWLVSRYDVQ